MAAFRSLTADRNPLEAFKVTALRSCGPKSVLAKTDGTDLPLHLFEWSQSSQDGVEISNVRTVTELEARDPATVRVIFAPQDVPAPETVHGLVRLFEKFQIPSAFIAESMQNISRSFAAQTDIDGTVYVWFHFLCKTVTVEGASIVGKQRPGNDNYEIQSQEDFGWVKPGFVLKIRRPRGLPRPPARSRTSSSDATMSGASTDASIELFCFGATASMGDRFRKLKNVAICDDLVQDPYVLLEVVFEEMYKVLDMTGWAISHVFGNIEKKTLHLATTPGKATKLPRDHFTGLHNLAKHITYLQENCDSALATLSGLRHHHGVVIGDHPDSAQEFTRQALDYRKTLFNSTQRRLSSLDKRMANIVQLSFHLVTVADSRVMHSESASMKSIAVTTLIFLPLSTIATIFGTQFIKLDDTAPYHVRVSPDFWLLWVVALPLTAIVLLIWRVWYYDVRGRLLDDLPARSAGERGWLGWKTAMLLGQRSRNVIPRTEI
ncbi:hypothetical protein C7974DRAFT_302739 [Boeremia exigua]|uniref:uncharacterized protein n=1 Tax=Boeremia exigua TaxID=749465 RepID=UPI001E8E800F|nr:uncharacterized protein C7974DRAFT_302739 [Boeremia exigua]KAH6642423.1 hypothetical protein C7974DRAFT_302739 [Boeremia exigua]